MNFYEHHIGDYAEATAHLTFVEDAAYSRLLRKYYATEKPLPADIKAVQRLVGARTEDERAAVDQVLQEFFDLRDDGWHQARCDQEIARFASGQPERDLRKANEANRLKRHRDERAKLFELITAAGEHLPYNAAIADVRALAAIVAARTPAVPTQPETPPETLQPPLHATAPATPATATQYPLPTTQEVIPPIPPKGAKRRKSEAIGLGAWIAVINAKGEKPIPVDDAVFEYAERAGIPDDFLHLAWLEFRQRYTQPDATRYADWRAVFRRAVRGNWLKLWRIDAQGVYRLTTEGEQAKRVHVEGRTA
jgi:uncharacterized protein YdaU (DUF1376 family)